MSSVRFEYEVIIANNGSTDRTLDIARGAECTYPFIRACDTTKKGRGGALCTAWAASRASVLSYTDVDLSTDLRVFPSLVEGLLTESFDIATASRLIKPSLTTRCLRREILSRCYNLLLHVAFRTNFSDAQCGCKALTRETVERLVPFVEDRGWFFDTELMITAERLGYRILEIPARWCENTDSRVQVIQTAMANLRGMMRLYKELSVGKYEPARKLS